MTGRDRIVVAVLLCAGLLAAGWFLILAPKREEASTLGGQIAVQKQTLDSALADVQAGQVAKRSYAHDYATVARLGTAVPEDDNVASLLLQVEKAAQATQIDFRSLKTGQGSGASTPPPAPPAPAPTTPDSSSSSSTAATTSAPATQLATATLPPGAAVGAAGFPTMPFSFQFTGNFFHLSDFLGQLERFLVVRNRSVSVSGRFMTIDGIALGAATDGFPHMQASIAATTYLLPASQGLTNGATAGGPAAVSGGNASGATASGVATPTAAATPVVR